MLELPSIPAVASICKQNEFVCVCEIFQRTDERACVCARVCVCVCVCVCRCVCPCLCVSAFACVCVFALIKFGKWFSDSQIDSALFPNWPCEFVSVCIVC